MNLLPLDLQFLVYAYLPYPKVVEDFPQLINKEKFWLQKAAIATGANWEDPRFQDFFFLANYLQYGKIKRYIRVLAYRGIAVAGTEMLPGSEIILQDPEILRYGVEHNYPRIIGYAFEKK